MEKVLVCITIQQNSRRLIQKGAEAALNIGGELHILHVEKGNTIFLKEDTAQLVQELFEYASELGGEVHVICDDDTPQRIAQFIEENEITTLVLGKSMKSKLRKRIQKDLGTCLNQLTREVKVIVLEREEEEDFEEMVMEEKTNRVRTSL